MEEAKVEPAALLPLDQGQIKKATQALLAYNADKQKSGDKVLLDVDQNVFLMVTVWKIPPKEQVIKINLPHSILPDTSEVCLFTKDEPGLTAEQTETLYKKLLDQHGITRINEVISYKTFKTEYKPFEAKRRLLNRFALFLAPLCVDLKAKDLAKEINKRIHGTILPVTNKGSCYMVRIGHTSMEASEITENIWKSVKVLHLKTSKSIALPVFHSSLHGVAAVQKKKGAGIQRTAKRKKKRSKTKPKTTDQADTKDNVSGALEADMPKTDGVEPTALESKEEEEEDIPQLPEIPGEATAIEKSNQQRPGRKSKMPKEEFLEKTQSKDALQSLAKPTVVPKRLKAPKSDKKPKTPKRELRKMKLPLSL
ncbi:hypothetical protein Chor_015190 [Crotalus horridus]